MADNNKENKDQKPKVIRVNFGFSWFYILLLIGLGFMLFGQGSSNPQKIEWPEVETMIQSGDVKEIVFVRNKFQGSITVRPDRIAKYEDKFGGKVPAKSPHFVFLVSNKFNPEVTFGELNDALPVRTSMVTGSFRKRLAAVV